MKLFDFIKNEDGAVTVDWVVLTAAIVGLGVAVISQVGGGVTALSGAISSNVSGQTVGYQNIVGNTTSNTSTNSGG